MPHTPLLFQPIGFRSVTARNRIVVSPMCQYSANDGLGDDWHIQHLGARAMGGAGIVFTEATHVSAVGRITPHCLGLWNPQHQALLRRDRRDHRARRRGAGRATRPCRPQGVGATPVGGRRADRAAGRRLGAAGTERDPHGRRRHRSARAQPPARSPTSPASSQHSARLAREAGVQVLELHGAHGYLLHSFLSPISNRRTDAYGGDADGRSRFLMETIDAVRSEWPADLPLWVRLSCADWLAGGLTIDDTVALCRRLAARGDVDLIDCSSGGVSSAQHIPSLHPGYQVPFADAVKHGAGIATGAVGMITEPTHAAEILANDRADVVLLARALLADPAWPLRAAKVLGVKPELPPQYQRAAL